MAAQTGGPSGAEGDLFSRGEGSSDVRDRFALSRAAASPGRRRKSGLPEDDEREGYSFDCISARICAQRSSRALIFSSWPSSLGE